MREWFEHGNARLYQHYRPVEKAKALLLIVHGIGEHGARYDNFAQFLNLNGYAVASYDQRGHGQSPGRRGYIYNWDEHRDDLEAWFHHIVSEHHGVPVFLLGHSLGGLLVYDFVVKRQPECAGVVLSAAALKVGEDLSPLLQKLAPILGRLLPRLQTTRLDPKFISRDPAVVAAYENDPLVYHEGMYARTGAEVLAVTKKVPRYYDRFHHPCLVLHGSADQLTEPAGSRQFYEQAAAPDKTLKIYEGWYHELLNEPDKETVYQDILTWLDRHLP